MVAEQPHGLAVRLGVRFGALRYGPARRKAASLVIAIAIEVLIVLLLLTLGSGIAGDKNGEQTVTEFAASDFAAPPEPEQQPEPQPETSTTAQTAQPVAQPEPLRPPLLSLIPQPSPDPPPAQPPPEPRPSPSPTIAARIKPGRSFGPADTGNPRTANDSQRVGTAPNGEPLYAARWYREPTDSELAGYLSTANGPGAALIACKTVPDYYVEDCVLLGETPPGSQIGRAVMAAAWQFRVRPARIGGREQFGSWVRIRIDYTLRQAPR